MRNKPSSGREITKMVFLFRSLNSSVKQLGGFSAACKFLASEIQVIGAIALLKRVARTLIASSQKEASSVKKNFFTYFQNPLALKFRPNPGEELNFHFEFLVEKRSQVGVEELLQLLERKLQPHRASLHITWVESEGSSLFTAMRAARKHAPVETDYIQIMRLNSTLLSDEGEAHSADDAFPKSAGSIGDFAYRAGSDDFVVWSDGGNEVFRSDIVLPEIEEALIANLDAKDVSDLFSVNELPHLTAILGKYSTISRFLNLQARHIRGLKLNNSHVVPFLESILTWQIFRDLNSQIWVVRDPSSFGTGEDYEPRNLARQANFNQKVRAVAYYLPQFHTTVENDEWHGEGFTEWTSVKSASPYWHGHRQQHLPHPDLGFYDLLEPESLYRQAELVQASGLEGLIFYHYWFNGKRILEKPAELVLRDKNLPLNFAFCWANENWTRRWDGNDSEILLEQIYSQKDAEDFILDLIPYFQDSRYLKVHGRPLLVIYRPNLLPEDGLYFQVWKRVCDEKGVPFPYIVGSLTRGVNMEMLHDYDAATQRVLHDWTGGNVTDAANDLIVAKGFNGKILDYGSVSQFYMENFQPGEHEVLPSIVPEWDNTARYHENAHALSGSNPALYKVWLSHVCRQLVQSVSDTQKRFVFINAWNEWAEGAHLEPDSISGYAYLNATNKVLTATNSDEQIEKFDSSLLNSKTQITVRVVLSQDVEGYFSRNPDKYDQFAKALNDSIPQVQNFNWFLSAENESGEFDLTMTVNSPCIFPNSTIGKMVDELLRLGHAVVSNSYGDPIGNLSESGRLLGKSKQHMVLEGLTYSRKSNLVSLCANAWSFRLLQNSIPRDKQVDVQTVMRVHEGTTYPELERALYSLAAMKDCRVSVLICTQSISVAKGSLFSGLYLKMAGLYDLQIQQKDFEADSPNVDLRSLMLNVGLQSSIHRYTAFLDSDDLLFPNAYAWLVSRLKLTNKAVAFGRVYKSFYASQLSKIIGRDVAYSKGLNFEDFLENNIFPLHSIMFDTESLDLSVVKFFESHTYMEDYYLTLQLIDNQNSDWASLPLNVYIGDYIFDVDRSQTLAITDSESLGKVLASEEYKLCQSRIDNLRREVRKKYRDSIRGARHSNQ